MHSVWSQAAEYACVTWTEVGPEVWCHHHSECVIWLLGFQTTALCARQQMASNKCELHSALHWSQGKRSSHLSLVQMTPVSQCSWNSIIMHLFVQNVNRKRKKKCMYIACHIPGTEYLPADDHRLFFFCVFMLEVRNLFTSCRQHETELLFHYWSELDMLWFQAKTVMRVGQVQW